MRRRGRANRSGRLTAAPARESVWSRILPRASDVSLPVLYMYALWFIILFDPHRWLASLGLTPFNRLASVAFLPLVVIIPLQGPAILLNMRKWVWYPLFLSFVVVALITIPLAPNRGLAWETVQPFVLYYLLAVGTFIFVRSVRQATPIFVMMFFLQFIWWQYHARTAGRVYWHPSLANFDGYGPLMVMGIAFAFYFAYAVRSRWLRWIGLAVAAGCVLGVVASFARGAFIGAAAVIVMIVLRSPHKGRAALAAVLSVIVITASAEILFPSGAFWHEMKTIVTENKETGTGADRWTLWGMAIEVFQERPVLGVGAGNFGAFAANYFEYGDEVAGTYAGNPRTLYNRSLHSLYFQILSEMGGVGSFVFLLLIFDFWRRNLKLRSEAALARWRRAGVDLDLRSLAIGLETAMVGCLVTGAFYALYLYMHWFYTLVAVNALLFGLVVESRGAPVAHAGTTGRGDRGPRPPGRGRQPAGRSSRGRKGRLRPAARRPAPALSSVRDSLVAGSAVGGSSVPGEEGDTRRGD